MKSSFIVSLIIIELIEIDFKSVEIPCSSNEKDMTSSDEIDLIGKAFATRFYDEFVGKPDASGLIRFFDKDSKYSIVQRYCGRPDYEVRGIALIGELAERMQYGRCTEMTVRWVQTAWVGPSRYKVCVVGKLLCPANDVARRFLQKTIVKHAPWTREKFIVMDTVFQFDDRIIDDVLPRTSIVDTTLFFSSWPEVEAAVDVRREFVRTMDVFNSNATKNPNSTLQKGMGSSASSRSLSGLPILADPEQATAAAEPTGNEISKTSVDSSSNESVEMSTNLETFVPSDPGRFKTSAAVPDKLIISPPPVPSPNAVTSDSGIRRVGSIYGQAFISEIIYPLLYSINPLDWF